MVRPADVALAVAVGAFSCGPAVVNEFVGRPGYRMDSTGPFDYGQPRTNTFHHSEKLLCEEDDARDYPACLAGGR